MIKSEQRVNANRSIRLIKRFGGDFFVEIESTIFPPSDFRYKVEIVDLFRNWQREQCGENRTLLQKVGAFKQPFNLLQFLALVRPN